MAKLSGEQLFRKVFKAQRKRKQYAIVSDPLINESILGDTKPATKQDVQTLRDELERQNRSLRELLDQIRKK